jgi:hypothetical protein
VVKALIEAHGPDHILFGSDTPGRRLPRGPADRNTRAAGGVERAIFTRTRGGFNRPPGDGIKNLLIVTEGISKWSGWDERVRQKKRCFGHERIGTLIVTGHPRHQHHHAVRVGDHLQARSKRNFCIAVLVLRR